jgi:hypothetical protein
MELYCMKTDDEISIADESGAILIAVSPEGFASMLEALSDWMDNDDEDSTVLDVEDSEQPTHWSACAHSGEGDDD